MKVTVTGRVRGKARPRVYRGHAFTPIETKTYENIIRCAYQNQSNIYYEGGIKMKKLNRNNAEIDFRKWFIEKGYNLYEWEVEEEEKTHTIKDVIDNEDKNDLYYKVTWKWKWSKERFVEVCIKE